MGRRHVARLPPFFYTTVHTSRRAEGHSTQSEVSGRWRTGQRSASQGRKPTEHRPAHRKAGPSSRPGRWQVAKRPAQHAPGQKSNGSLAVQCRRWERRRRHASPPTPRYNGWPLRKAHSPWQRESERAKARARVRAPESERRGRDNK